MTTIASAVEAVKHAQKRSKKPLAIILAGHNGSGKSTLWYRQLANQFQIPLINADRMMMSILPEVTESQPLPQWASSLRDKDQSWMTVAQQGLFAFVAQAMAYQVPFAMETVFSYWKETEGGKIESKIDLIKQMQSNGYYVLLLFVGLSNVQLSIARVNTRVFAGGHDVDFKKLISRFPRTQKAIKEAVSVADAAILADNSRKAGSAFTICRVQMGTEEIYDYRKAVARKQSVILDWLNVVSPSN